VGAGIAAAVAAQVPAAAALDGAGAVAALAPAPAGALAPAPASLGAVAALLPVVPAAAVGLAGLGAPVAGAPMIPNVQVRNNLMALQQQRYDCSRACNFRCKQCAISRNHNWSSRKGYCTSLRSAAAARSAILSATVKRSC
jgi:hypothetical protein